VGATDRVGGPGLLVVAVGGRGLLGVGVEERGRIGGVVVEGVAVRGCGLGAGRAVCCWFSGGLGLFWVVLYESAVDVEGNEHVGHLSDVVENVASDDAFEWVHRVELICVGFI